MTKYEVVLGSFAQNDLQNIKKYCLETSYSLDTFDKLVEQFTNTKNSLTTLPNRCHAYSKKIDGATIRVAISGDYRLYFVVNEIDRMVYIITILHYRQDETEILQTVFYNSNLPKSQLSEDTIVPY